MHFQTCYWAVSWHCHKYESPVYFIRHNVVTVRHQTMSKGQMLHTYHASLYEWLIIIKADAEVLSKYSVFDFSQSWARLLITMCINSLMWGFRLFNIVRLLLGRNWCEDPRGQCVVQASLVQKNSTKTFLTRDKNHYSNLIKLFKNVVFFLVKFHKTGRKTDTQPKVKIAHRSVKIIEDKIKTKTK